VKTLTLDSVTPSGVQTGFSDDETGSFSTTSFQPFYFSCKIGF
jgi:hypothetical protein